MVCCCNLLSMLLAFHHGAVQIFSLWMKHLIREQSHHQRGHCKNLNSDCTSHITDISVTPNCKVTATCNQMNAPCEHLRRKKAPQCAWSIRRDAGHVLRMQETSPCSCYCALLARGQFLESARTCPYMFIYLSRPCEHVYGTELKA